MELNGHAPAVREGGHKDADAVLGMLDAAVAWLVGQGRTGQWGSSPFSSSAARVARIEGYLHRRMVRIAETDGRPVGACTLDEEPPAYVDPAPERELYVHLLVTARGSRGTGVGAVLIDDARKEARRRGITRLRVYCCADDDRALVRQYERLGFTRAEAFTVEREGQAPWPGQVLEMRLQ